jgi:heme/copper-type cytochrome/quinol oxidase subunit 1
MKLEGIQQFIWAAAITVTLLPLSLTVIAGPTAILLIDRNINTLPFDPAGITM